MSGRCGALKIYPYWFKCVAMNMIINAQDTQFKLSDAGEILFQKLPGNPLPGEPIAVLQKGDTPLLPKVLTSDAEGMEPVRAHLEGWVSRHIGEVLAPLVRLKEKAETEIISEPAQGLFDVLYDSMGVIHREELEVFIKALDADGRIPIRARKVKMGPLLVFLYELNKPAAVRLKALLWSLYHGESLPAPTPKDGVVSLVIDPEAVNRKFYQVIGYPVFGPRAIRIDMLDRVVNAVYDSAAEGKFQAKHQMAEWLGCSIDDLYAILRAMGHKQIKEESQKAEALPIDGDVAVAVESAQSDEAAEGKKADVKPELCWFWIKKGRASEKPVKAKPRVESHKKPDQKVFSKKDKKGKKDAHGKMDRKPKDPKVYAFGGDSNPEDSPFAILQQLKNK